MNQALKGDCLIFTALLIFGAYSIYLRAFPAIPVMLFLLAFQVVAMVFFAAIGGWRTPLNWHARALPIMLLFAVACLGNDLCLFYAFRLTSVANAAIAHQMVSFFLIILSPWLLGEKNQRRELIALAISFVGVVIIYSEGISLSSRDDVLGTTLGLLSAFFYALILIGYIYFERAGLPVRATNFWRFSFSTLLLLLPFSWLGIGINPAADILPLFMFGAIFGFVAVAIHTTGIAISRPLHASIIGKCEPVIAIAYAYWFLSETPSVSTICGGALIIGASLWLAVAETT